MKHLVVAKRVLLTSLFFLVVNAATAADIEPALSVEVGSPLKHSGNLGIRIGTVGKDGSDYGRGLLLQVQPGLGGVSFNLGFAPVALPSWGTQAVGLAIKARVLRTWDDPWGGLAPDQTYAGGEVALAWIIKISFGVVTRLNDGVGKKTIFTWSVGVGL